MVRAISMLVFIASLTFLSSAFAVAESFKVMTINTEWLWTPHDARVDGGKFNKGDMSPAAYARELDFYTALIEQHGVQLVALSEIENSHVAKDFAEKLGKGWRAIFMQGRDTATGQDVALISSLKYVESSETDFDFPAGRLSSDKTSYKGKRLSKIVGARFEFEDQAGGVLRLGVITSHFLSKRNDSKKKSANRLRQAYALGRAIDAFDNKVDGMIVLGDLNDYLHSKPLQYLQKTHQLASVEDECSDNRKQYTIDHVLFKGIACRMSRHLDLSTYSDHDAVLAKFNWP